MDDNVAIVEQHPLGFLDAFPPQRFPIIYPQTALDTVDQSFDLAGSCPGSDDEDVGDDQQLVNVEQNDADTLLIIQCGRGGPSQRRGLGWNLDVLPRVIGKVSPNNDTDIHHT